MSARVLPDNDFLYNPLGTEGFEFVEFAAPNASELANAFAKLGFTAVAHHRDQPLVWYQQGHIHFLLNEDPKGYTNRYTQSHGPNACALGLKVRNAQKALDYATVRQARPCGRRMLEFNIPALYGVGDSLLYLVDDNGRQKLYREQFEPLVEVVDDPGYLKEIDHLSQNVEGEHLIEWSGFYHRVLNFHDEAQTINGPESVMVSPCGNVRIPINEAAAVDPDLHHFIEQFHGEGIQHIALATDDIVTAITHLRERGLPFMAVPDSYYERLEERLPGHGQDLERLQKLGILLDGYQENGHWQLLYQAFTDKLVGPLFFEIIQRKGSCRYGEGNLVAFSKLIP